MDAICAMHELDQCGQITGSIDDLARICRCTSNELRGALADLKLRNTGEINERVTDGNTQVTLINRRMRRTWTDRKSVARRVAKYRAKNGNGPSNGEVTPLKQGYVRSQKSDHQKEDDRPPPAEGGKNHRPPAAPDDLDTTIRKFFDASDMLLWSEAEHAALRKIVVASSWAKANECLQVAFGKRAGRPCAYALSVFSSDQIQTDHKKPKASSSSDWKKKPWTQ